MSKWLDKPDVALITDNLLSPVAAQIDDDKLIRLRAGMRIALLDAYYSGAALAIDDVANRLVKVPKS